MSEQYCQSVLRIALAQICQSVGWNSAQSTPLELLTDVMGRYMLQLAKVTHRYGEQFGRTNPNLDDVGLAFRHMGVSISELEEYVRHVEPLPFAHEIVQFPAPRSSNLQIPKPGHKELQTREEHIEDYMPLMFPTPEDEMDTEAEKPQDQIEGTGGLQSNQGQAGVAGQAEVTDSNSLSVPGDKRALTSPLEGSLPKKRPRLTNAALPEEAMHSQYEMKSIAITHTGDLTPTKGGKLPDARTPPQGFKKASHDRPSVVKNYRKDKGDTRPSTPVDRTEKAAENVELPKVETTGKEKAQTVEEIMIYPDGRSEKVPQQQETDEVSDSEPLPKVASASARDKISAPSSATQVKKKKVGRPRSRSKSPRTPKSPGQGKSPARSPGSSRGRGRPPKDKSLLKNPDKKKDLIKNKPVLSTMEEMFASDVLDLSRKPPPPPPPKETVEKKEPEADVPLDLSKSKEPAQKSARGRGRPPLSPEKKRVRERNIDLCIEAVLQRSREGNPEGDAIKEKEIKAEKVTELAESNQEDTNPAIEDSSDGPVSVTVKKEMIEESGPLFDISEQKKKKKKERAPKQKEEQSGEEVKDKLKDKLKGKDSVSEGIKTEPQEEVAGPPNVYDFPESPPKPAEQIKKEAAPSPQKMFSVEFVDKEMENKEGEKTKEKSKDKERSKEHKEKRKDKKRDKEKKKKNKDKDRDREKKKDKEKSKEPEYIPTVSKLKIRIGSSPSSTTVNYMSEGSLKSPPSDSAQNSPRPELKLVIKALPPKSERGSASPQSLGGSTPRDGEKERKKEKKKDREKKKETPAPIPAPSPHIPVKQESMDQPLFAPLPISRQHTPFSSSPSKSPTPPPPRKPSPPGLFTPFIKTPTPPPRKTPTPPPRKTPTPPPPRKSPTPPPPKVPTPIPKPPTPETDFEPDSDHETEVMKDEELQRFTPSPASTRKTFTPSPSNSPIRSPSPAAESVTSYMRSKSNSQSPVHTPSPGQSTSPHPSPPPSPSPSPFRASVSPSNTKPSTPSHMTSRSPSPSPSPSSTPRTIKSEIIPPMPPPSMPGISSVKAGVQRTVIAETVTTFIDESGQKVWICPACKMPDDGSPMIGCDICDDWYHWPCVGVKEEPAEDENWYCSKCMGRNKKPAKRGRGRGRGRGPGRGKKKMM